MRLRRFVILVLLGGLLPAFTCSRRIPVDMNDVDVPPPSQKQLDIWQRDYESGTTWRSDPRRLAHEEIQLRLDVPWKGEDFAPAKYEFVEHNPEKPHWGSYAIRRYTDLSGRLVSYQVQMAKHRNVWYAVKVRHYYGIDVSHPALEDQYPRRH